MKMFFSLFVLAISSSIGSVILGPLCATATDVNKPSVTGSTPLVQITTDSRFTRKQRLKFRVRIENPGTEPIFVYSALFNHSRFAETVIDVRQRVIEVRFSRLETSPILPYYFPRAEFWEIGARQTREFVCSFDIPLSQMRSYQSVNNKTRAERLTSGDWALRIMIGYGDDISTLKQSLARAHAVGTEHPINEIVNWQKVAYSNSSPITLG
jgi:hypothetical protein